MKVRVSEELFLVRVGRADGPFEHADIRIWGKYLDRSTREAQTNPGFSFGQSRETRCKFGLQWRTRPGGDPWSVQRFDGHPSPV